MHLAKHYALYAGVGAVAYWVPDMLVQWIQPPHVVWIGLLTFAVPAIVLITWYALSKRVPHSNFRVGLPLFMLLGIWLVSPLAIALGMVPAGGKFLEPDQLGTFLMLWAAFPMSTFIMSTYSGSLGGVGLVTLALIVAAIVSGLRGKTSNIVVERDGPQAARPSP
jgi:hypothetical protein